jgi:hypothetical protein
MMRGLRPLALGSLLSGGVAVSCLVSNVELVDRLPGANDGGTGADGVAGTATGAEGGDDPGPVGGADSGGSSSGPGGRAGSSGDGSNPPGGSGPGGGSSGLAGGGTGGRYTTAPSDWVFGDKGGCDTQAPALMCDDFETEHDLAWLGGLPGTTPTVTDAPSGDHVWLSSFKSAAMNVTPGVEGFNVSFWVRLLGGSGDHVFIDWTGPGHTRLSFGIEGEAYRFRLASSPMAYSAPQLLKHTRNASYDKWTCVELEYKDATFQATVTVLGDAPVKLALVGGKADAGIDQELLELGSAEALDLGPDWALGETGAELQFDDVRVVPLGQPSVCQDFIAANNP